MKKIETLDIAYVVGGAHDRLYNFIEKKCIEDTSESYRHIVTILHEIYAEILHGRNMNTLKHNSKTKYYAIRLKKLFLGADKDFTKNTKEILNEVEKLDNDSLRLILRNINTYIPVGSDGKF